MKRIVVTLFVILLGACGSDKPIPIVILDTGGTSDAGSDTRSSADSGPDAEADVFVPPPPGYGEVLFEGNLEITDGVSQRLRFDVPDDAVSVHISVIGVEGEIYGLGEWTNGDGSVLVNPNWAETDAGRPSLCIGCPNRITSSEGAFGGIAPNNQNVQLVAGEHTVSAIGYAQVGFSFNPVPSRMVDIRVVAKLRDSEPTTGTLDVNFYFTGALWDAESAQEANSSFQDVLSNVEDIYGAVGIEIGNVTYTDIGEEHQIVTNVIAPRSGIQELWKMTESASQAAINVFLVKEIYGLAGPGFGVILGLSGGIPGPNVVGTARSGVVVAVDSEMAPPGTRIHSVIAHEMGHHLGLFHSSESQQNIHDQLNDTPQNDVTNLMFHSGTGTGLSATQGLVMRLNPWVDTGERQ